MKNLHYLLLCFMIISIGSCDYLEYDEIEKYGDDLIWKDRYRTRDFLGNVYNHMVTDFNQVGGAVRASGADDAEEISSFYDIQKMNDGRWNATQTVDSRWTSLYEGIRQANLFLEKFDIENFKERQYNEDYKQQIEQFRLFPYQARFLRALLYFKLIKRYDHVPLVTKSLKLEEANTVKPSSYEEVTDFIISESEAVAPQLPITYESEPFKETGRATRGAALALKARALLYAASPSHNPSNDIDKWKKAAAAAKAVIDAGFYSLETDYSDAFNNTESDELILGYREGSANYFERDNFPIGYEGANKNGTNPTQNLVNAFEMKSTGLPIDDPASGYDPQNPYQGRDPRLQETVIVNNSSWKGRKVQMWEGGLDGPPTTGATKTGYYLKKYVQEGVSFSTTNTTTARHVWVIFRYGGILLNYAEAMNEAYGPDNPADMGMSARQAVNKIRARAGMPGFPGGMSKSEFREKYRNERRVEMAFENQRFWDIRRWKIGPSTTEIKGVDVIKNADGSFTYNEKTIENRVWDDKMYLYPIPQSEIFNNEALKQNPGW